MNTCQVSTKTLPKIVISTLCLVLSSSVFAVPAASSTSLCDRALHAVSSQHGALTDAQPVEVFRVDLGSTSLLSAEVSDLTPRGKGYAVRWLDGECRPLGRRMLALHPAHGALIVPPGTYHAAVYGKNLGEYHLAIDAAPWSSTDATGTDDPPEDPVDEWEEMILGTGIGQDANGTDDPPEDPVDEWEEARFGTGVGQDANGTDDPPEDPVDEWEEMRAGTGVGQDTNGTDDPPEDPVDEWEEMYVGVSEVAQQLRRLCALRVSDTEVSNAHGATPLCGLPIHLGGRTVGSIRWDASGDRDAFLFVVPQRARVLFASRGASDLRGRLFSVDGNALVAEGYEAGGDFFLTAELPAGRYLLRVDSPAGGGGYELLHGILAAGWDL